MGEQKNLTPAISSGEGFFCPEYTCPQRPALQKIPRAKNQVFSAIIFLVDLGFIKLCFYNMGGFIVAAVIIWFLFFNKKKPKIEKKKNIDTKPVYKKDIVITGPNPEKTTDYLFYKFIQNFENEVHLKAWFDDCIIKGYNIKEEYKEAVSQKVKTGSFKNPINFEEFYGLKYDYIAIDFETANSERISACKIGLAIVQNDEIIDTRSYFIKPPKHISFSAFNSSIHGIYAEDVIYHPTFEFIWESHLSIIFNNNLIALHNASMDASVLRQLFEYYNLTDFDFDYIDTMQIAKNHNMPAKLTDLVSFFGSKVDGHHNPEKDAEYCAFIVSNFIEKGIDINGYRKNLAEKPKKISKNIKSQK